MDDFWLTHGKLITPRGIVSGAVKVSQGRIAAIRTVVPRGARSINLRGAYLAPGFIDLHVWGPPQTVSQEAVKAGTTTFLTTLGPESPAPLRAHTAERSALRQWPGAECAGVHLEGPFVNPQRAGALPKRAMRAPTVRELARLARAARGRLKLLTLAPELRGAKAAIRWCARHGIAVSLGHSVADAARARDAVEAGASAVTHVFNGMPPLHHRQPSLLDVALTDPRLTTMVIADGVHVGASSLRLLAAVKGAAKIALVTDSIRYQGWDVVARHGAYYTRNGTLAGGRLTMIEAVRHMVELAGVSLGEAVGMATAVPARLLGLASRGVLAVGRRADLVAFDTKFCVLLTMVGGRVVYQRRGF